ncbi:MAG: glycine cleavage system protein GcvH [candidate division NC10 bacterium]|nr:glycine cleavage system protein GcvH [candidate division NC10 bacterium]
MYPGDLKYSKEHTWIKVEGERGRVGITYFAQAELGDVVFVELPPVGRRLRQLEPFGVVESVKAVSDLYSPVSGEVLEVNTLLESQPELVNSNPYGSGWIVVLKIQGPQELENLLSAGDYQGYVELGRAEHQNKTTY